jgi:hypothetical protein
MARIALMDKRMFLQLMSATAGALNKPETELWEGVLDEWWRRVCYSVGFSSLLTHAIL